MRKAKQQIRVKGVGGTQLIVDKVGDLEGFFKVYTSEHAKANALSFADVEDRYMITYKKGKALMVQMACGKTAVFAHRRNKLYIANWASIGLYVCTTVRENEQIYTPDEVRRAQLAYELVRTSGYPSPNEVLHLIQDSNIKECWHLV